MYRHDRDEPQWQQGLQKHLAIFAKNFAFIAILKKIKSMRSGTQKAKVNILGSQLCDLVVLCVLVFHYAFLCLKEILPNLYILARDEAGISHIL